MKLTHIISGGVTYGEPEYLPCVEGHPVSPTCGPCGEAEGIVIFTGQMLCAERGSLDRGPEVGELHTVIYVVGAGHDRACEVAQQQR